MTLPPDPAEVLPLPQVDPGPPRPVARGRVTVVSTVYHQVPGEQLVAAPQAKYSIWLDSDEEAFDRTVKVGPDWVPLDLGWVGTQASVLVLTNVTKRQPGVIPSEAEQEEENSRVIEVGLEFPNGEILGFGEMRKGEHTPIHPIHLTQYRLRTSSGECKCSIFLVPA